MSLFRKHSTPSSLSEPFPTFLHSTIPFRRRSNRHSSSASSASASAASCLSFDSQLGSTSTRTSVSTSSNPFLASSPISNIVANDFAFIEEDDQDSQQDRILHGNNSHIRCAKCSTDLCLTSQIISKGFTGRHGRAYLVAGSPSQVSLRSMHRDKDKATLPNTHLHKPVPRNLVTGAHTVSDISCAICGSVLGWKYVNAQEEGQRYKVGKFILETRRVRVGVCWEGEQEDEHVETNDKEEEGNRQNSHLPFAMDDVIKEGEAEFDSQDEDECEDLFAGVWSAETAATRRGQRQGRRGNGRRKVGFNGEGSSSRSSLRTGSNEY